MIPWCYVRRSYFVWLKIRIASSWRNWLLWDTRVFLFRDPKYTENLSPRIWNTERESGKHCWAWRCALVLPTEKLRQLRETLSKKGETIRTNKLRQNQTLHNYIGIFNTIELEYLCMVKLVKFCYIYFITIFKKKNVFLYRALDLL